MILVHYPVYSVFKCVTYNWMSLVCCVCLQLEKTAMREENERLSGELERGRRPSAGRAGVESELALKRKELVSAQRDLQTAREEREMSEREAGEARRELEREKERSAELESK